MKDKKRRNGHQLITLARSELMLEKPFFGMLLMQLTPFPDRGLLGPTATDGKRLFYDPEWIEKYSPAEVMGLTAHEVLHVGLRHTNGHRGNRTGDREQLQWNIATDAVINSIITTDGIKLPAGGVECYSDHIELGEDIPEEGKTRQSIPLVPELEKQVSYYSAEQIYRRIQMPPEMKAHIDCGLMDPKTGEKDRKEGNGGAGPKKMSEVEAKMWEQKLKRAAEVAKAAGKLPGGMETQIETLRPPQKNWREILDRFVQRVKEDYSWNPPDRRSYAISQEMDDDVEIILPSLTDGEVISNIIIAIDTSGSVDDDALCDFVSEAFSIARIGVNLILVYCDSIIQHWEPLSAKKAPPYPKGRGGTHFQPVFERIAEEGLDVEALVYLTDGMPNAGWPERSRFPVLWIINNDTYKPPWGETVVYTPSRSGRRKT